MKQGMNEVKREKTRAHSFLSLACFSPFHFIHSYSYY